MGHRARIYSPGARQGIQERLKCKETKKKPRYGCAAVFSDCLGRSGNLVDFNIVQEQNTGRIDIIADSQAIEHAGVRGERKIPGHMG
jgi:hypothetical protein